MTSTQLFAMLYDMNTIFDFIFVNICLGIEHNYRVDHMMETGSGTSSYNYFL